VSPLAALDGAAFDPVALGIPRFVHRAVVSSTMDVAHDLAADGAAHGTVVLADGQQAGRGRSGRRWHAGTADGLWMTCVLRAVTPGALGLLSLRAGLVVAEAVAPCLSGFAGLKWPNDVLAAPGADVQAARQAPWPSLGKVAGILVEARWREGVLDWVAIGIGINRRVPPDVVEALEGRRAAAVLPGTRRADLLTAIVPGLLALGAGEATLSPAERAAWDARDVMPGRRVVSPGAGVVLGLAADGALRIRAADGTEHQHRSGSLELSP
jgi:BirA family biotin operon repressor/biotin-[acetyl-CoA-carboxylase] ligase